MSMEFSLENIREDSLKIFYYQTQLDVANLSKMEKISFAI